MKETNFQHVDRTRGRGLGGTTAGLPCLAGVHRHKHTHTLSLTHTLFLSLSLSLTHILSLSLSLSHTHTHSPSLKYTHTLSFSLSLSNTNTLSLTHTHTHTHTHSHTGDCTEHVQTTPGGNPCTEYARKRTFSLLRSQCICSIIINITTCCRSPDAPGPSATSIVFSTIGETVKSYGDINRGDNGPQNDSVPLNTRCTLQAPSVKTQRDLVKSRLFRPCAHRGLATSGVPQGENNLKVRLRKRQWVLRTVGSHTTQRSSLAQRRNAWRTHCDADAQDDLEAGVTPKGVVHSCFRLAASCVASLNQPIDATSSNTTFFRRGVH